MGALDGLKIADFSWVGAGPRATKDLADNGATVIKIESHKRLDLGRRSPPFAGDPSDVDGSAFFAQTNTSKKSVTINLGDRRGVEIAKKLVGWADVVVENFGPGFMERIGLDYAALKAIKSDIILASVSVAGKTGPMAGFRGYGNSAAAHSGHAALTGYPNSDPHMPPLAYGDVVAPMFLTVAILGALEFRSRTGQGQHLDVSQIEPMVQVIGDLYAQDNPLKNGNDDPAFLVHGVFPTFGEDQWIAIAVETDVQARALESALGIAADQLSPAAIASATATFDKFALFDRLSAVGVPAGPVLDGREIKDNAELIAAGHFQNPDHAILGKANMPAPPYRLSRTPWSVGPSPLLGANNREVFVEMLGLDGSEIESLIAEGTLA
ncbi:CaiB/BaiF CoA transferase family protein [Pelagibacterium limicola]|uniref:CaiB/BaiF CoA transferase family protein n=1 Tax=Pelagibacterium limicola TaxID=2791022 RepID=UPI0018AFD3AC|nr:CoA transferase [Pelagibacterium limicola]